MNKYTYQGCITRKRFGQNFLYDSTIIDAIVAVIRPELGQAMVEIGPGLGALTIPMVRCIDKITVIELDRDLVTCLANHPFLQSKLNVVTQNVMTVDFAALSAKLKQPLRVFGNLPYNISTPLMFHLFRYANVIFDMHFMLQKEVVNRLVAAPNSKSYGRLSIMAQYYCQITPMFEVSPASFRPMPKVNSVVVRLLPYITLPFPVKKLSKLALLTSIAFSQRRKMLSNSLSGLFNARQLAEQGIDATLRAENISVEHYCRLANVLSERSVL